MSIFILGVLILQKKDEIYGI